MSTESRKAGRPKFEPTVEAREMVKELSGLGARQQDILRFLKNHLGVDIGDATLRKYFADELEFGTAEANAKVANTLFKMATSGAVPSATFFWLKTRARWQETPQQVAFTDADGNPVQPPTLADFYAAVKASGADQDTDTPGQG